MWLSKRFCRLIILAVLALAANDFASGQQIKPMLASLALKAEVKSPLPTPPTTTLAATAPILAETILRNEDSSSRVLDGILDLLATIAVLLAMGIFMFWRRQTYTTTAIRPPRVLLMPDDTATDLPSVETWKQRALAAEAMAGKQGQLLREKLIPELTEFAKQSLVQGLYEQRKVLMDTQRKAQLALMELESRLNTIQAPLHERIRAYEMRIAELEREVETQGEEVRELTRATLMLVRRKLEEERESERLQSRFN